MGVNVRHSAFLCPGQASQKVGMCKDIYELNDYAKDRIDSANDILGYDIKTICFLYYHLWHMFRNVYGASYNNTS